MSFFPFLKAVATGPKSNRDLSFDECFEAFKMILDQKCEIEQSAAFLMCLRVKLESSDELKACFEACNTYIKKVEIPESIELGFSYDGKTNQPYLFPLYAKILKKFFKNNKDYKSFDLIISGDYLQPAKNGITVKELCKNVKIADNIHFFDRKEYFQELSNLTDLRKKLFLRSIFNTVEKLLNPASSKYALTSAFHKPYVKKYNLLFKENYENLLVLKGNEGNPEVFSDFKYWEEENDELIEHKIFLKDFDIYYTTEYENISINENINIINNPSPELYKLAKLNAAILLFTTKRVPSIKEAYDLLKDT